MHQYYAQAIYTPNKNDDEGEDGSADAVIVKNIKKNIKNHIRGTLIINNNPRYASRIGHALY